MPRLLSRALLALGLAALATVLLLLRFAAVTDYMYHALVKDPERVPPAGRVIVAPADGTVIYVRRVENGVAPEVVKRGVPVPLAEHARLGGERSFPDGWLVGIYMNTDGVHVNRAPVAGRVSERRVWNGPHMDMSAAERTIVLTQLLPGWVTLKKLLGLPPYAIENTADFVLKSARETLVLRDRRETDVLVVRIADFTVGKILTWVREGDEVALGQKLGLITWGSQTDVFFADTPGTTPRARVGSYVYAGESVLATW
jgi:phosphatidylserine decarboxylase